MREMEGEARRSEATSNNKEKEEEAQAKVDIWKYVFGFVDMAVVKCAIELGIADVLEAHEGPMTLSDLSTALRCSPAALHRIMRYLVHQKIFKKDFTNQGGPIISYVQTPLSRLLVKNGENSMASFLLLESSPVMLAPWHALSARVLANGSSAFEVAHGDDLWTYAAKNPAHCKLIDDAMACDARVAVPAIIGGCPEVFDGLSSLVDVGGGNGTASQMIVKSCPWIHGINFDLPHVVAVAPNYVGVEHVGGDMFVSIPKADAAFFMVS